MTGYYSEKLAGERLREMYEAAPPRIQQYLNAEIEHVLSLLSGKDGVIELGCGYGRVLSQMVPHCEWAVGIDTSMSSLQLACTLLAAAENCALTCMDATRLAFPDHAFDFVLCIQNGVSAFHVDQRALINEAVRVARSGATVLFSSYAEGFWEPRLDWFTRQAHDGFVGEIDHNRTGHGRIVCKDGFTATTVSPKEFESMTYLLDADVSIYEVDQSSLFCRITPH